ncbi:MAG: fatty acid desaturase, partial [Flavobacteriales bacterium]
LRDVYKRQVQTHMRSVSVPNNYDASAVNSLLPLTSVCQRMIIIVQHHSISHQKILLHQLQTSSNFGVKSRMLTWLCGGLNYQIEHHLFPNMCHLHYRKIAPIVKRTAKEFGLPYRADVSFGQALKLHTAMLKSLGRPAPIA